MDKSEGVKTFGEKLEQAIAKTTMDTVEGVERIFVEELLVNKNECKEDSSPPAEMLRASSYDRTFEYRYICTDI